MKPSKEIRNRAKSFYNALDLDTPINFGVDDLVERCLEQGLYVDHIHGTGSRDPVEELASHIDFSEGSGSYLFTGNRGTGKTTELLRLAKLLHDFDCEVFYADMSEYITLTQRIEITDFLISVVGAFSEKVDARFNQQTKNEGFFERVLSFLNSDVRFDEVKIPAGPAELKASLHQNPSFKSELQQKTRGLVEQLVRQAREFVNEAVRTVRDERADENKKIVLIIDSVERLRGVGDSKDVGEVFKSAETLFASHADKLRFTGLNTIYTVPPYLSALAGGLGAYYSGGRIYSLPSVHIYQCCPGVGETPKPYTDGLSKMCTIVGRRYPQWEAFFSQAQLERLATNSGGDLRDFFRMLRLAIARAPALNQLPLPDELLSDAEDAVRNDMLPMAADDRGWLKKIMARHKPELPSRDALPEFARLQQGKYVLQYQNGEEWYDVHPLLRAEVGPLHE